MKNLLIITALFSFTCLFSQEQTFRVKYSSPSKFNPALTGNVNGSRLNVLSSLINPHSSSLYYQGYAGYDFYLNKIGGFGFNYELSANDDEVFQEHEWNISYARHFLITRKSWLSIGFNTGLNYSKVKLGGALLPQPSPFYGSGEAYDYELDFGILYSRQNLQLGAGIFEIPRVADPYKPVLLQLQGAFIKPIGANINIGMESSFSAQGGFYTFTTSLQTKYKFLIIGLRHQTRMNVGLIVGTSFPKFRCSYNYNIQLSSLSNAYFTSHNLTLRLDFPSKKQINNKMFNWLFF